MNKSIKELELELLFADQRLSFFILKKNDILRNNNSVGLEKCEEELEYWCNVCINILRKIKIQKKAFEPELKQIENEFKEKK